MDEKQAWRNFAQTGKIEDYIKYTQVRSQTGAEGYAAPAIQEVRSVFPVEVANDASKDTGPDHPRADGGGER